MSDGVQANIRAIQSMEAATARFSRVVSDRLPVIERELRRASDTLEERRDELRRQISHLEDEVSSAEDDDDTSSASRRLEDAEEKLQSVQNCIRRLADAGAAYAAKSRTLAQLSTDHSLRTQEFLRGVLDDLKALVDKTTEAPANSNSGFSTPLPIGAVASSPSSKFAPTADNGNLSRATADFDFRDVDAFRKQQGYLALEAKTKEYEHRKPQYSELSRLTVEEFLAINRYTQHDFENINNALRVNHVDTLQSWGPQIRLAVSGLNKLPACEGLVYRGVGAGEFAEGYIPGQIVAEPGFTSASHDSRLSSGFGKVQFEILSKAGRDIRSCSAMQSPAAREKEVLFVPNTRFEVTGRLETKEATVIQMKEL